WRRLNRHRSNWATEILSLQVGARRADFEWSSLLPFCRDCGIALAEMVRRRNHAALFPIADVFGVARRGLHDIALMVDVHSVVVPARPLSCGKRGLMPNRIDAGFHFFGEE